MNYKIFYTMVCALGLSIIHGQSQSINDSLKQNAYQSAKFWAAQQQQDSAFHYLYIATQQDSGMWRLLSGEFYPLLEEKQWKEIVKQQLGKYEAKFGQIPKKELTEQLCHLFVADQAFLTIDPRDDSMNNVTKIKSERNLQQLELLIAKYGWAKMSEIGWEFSSIPFSIVHHTCNLTVMEKYLPYIKKNVKNGEEFPMDLAYLTDRIRVYKGKKQIYGTQLDFDKEKKVLFFSKSSVVKPNKINKRRLSVGLNTIEEYAESVNAEIRE